MPWPAWGRPHKRVGRGRGPAGGGDVRRVAPSAGRAPLGQRLLARPRSPQSPPHLQAPQALLLP